MMARYNLGLLLFSILSVSPALAQTFQTRRTEDVWWLQSAEKQTFWSLGVCCVDQGEAQYSPSNPAFSATRLYPTTKAWRQQTQANLQQWHFNTLGGWSDTKAFTLESGKNRLPYCVVLHLGAYDNAPWNDVFSPNLEKAVDGAAREQIAKVKDDPNLIGYFTDNELGWWDETLFLYYFAMKPETPGKKALIALFQKEYRSDFAALQKDWVTDAKDFDELASKTRLTLRTGGKGRQRIVTEWTRLMAERYYSVVQVAVRKYDKPHLILGDRYAQYYSLPVVQASAKYLDVASTNMGADWNDGSLSHFFLETLYRATGKPLIISEFYMAARENRSGNKNSGNAFPVVQTQAERAKAFAKNVRSLAALPYVVGAHWFQYYDEPTKGRKDGEDFNMGLVDINGKPYEQLTQASRSLNIETLHRNASSFRAIAEVPPAPKNPLQSLKLWERKRGFVPSQTRLAAADLYVCCDAENLYLGLYAMDFMDEQIYADGHIPESERSLWTVKISGMKQTISVRFGGKDRAVKTDNAEIEAREISGLKHTVILRIPRRLFSKTSFAAQNKTAFTSALELHSGSAAMRWVQKRLLSP